MLLNCGVGEDSWESLDCKEIQPVHPKGDQSWYSFEGLMLKLKLQYFGHLMRRADSLEKTLMLGKIEGRRRRGQQRMRRLDGITDLMDMGLSKFQELVMDRCSMVCYSPWGRKESDTTERLNWTELNPWGLQSHDWITSQRPLTPNLRGWASSHTFWEGDKNIQSTAVIL